MVYTIQEIRSKVLPILEKYRIPAMYLFGSYARGDATEDSDLDFLIDTTGTELTSLLRFCHMIYLILEKLISRYIQSIRDL